MGSSPGARCPRSRSVSACHLGWPLSGNLAREAESLQLAVSDRRDGTRAVCSSRVAVRPTAAGRCSTKRSFDASACSDMDGSRFFSASSEICRAWLMKSPSRATMTAPAFPWVIAEREFRSPARCVLPGAVSLRWFSVLPPPPVAAARQACAALRISSARGPCTATPCRTNRPRGTQNRP